MRLPADAVRAVLATARALVEGELAVHVGADAETLHADLLTRPRIGDWTASYIVMRVLGDPDVWLPRDVALVAGARAVGFLDGGVSVAAAHRALVERSEQWAPWRSYAVVHLWRAATQHAATTSSATRKDPS